MTQHANKLSVEDLKKLLEADGAIEYSLEDKDFVPSDDYSSSSEEYNESSDE